MALNDNTKRIIFVALAAILLLSIILPLAAARFNNANSVVDIQHSKYLWWAIEITRLLTIITIILWLVLSFYSDWLRSRIDSIERASRMKIVVSVIWWGIIIILILLAIKFLMVLCRGSHQIVLASIKYAIISLLFVWVLPDIWRSFQYFHTQPTCKIIAASFVERHEKYVKISNFDKAYSALLKACETDPDRVWFWCKLALFCQQFRKNSAEADKYMTKAEELTTTNISDKACYLDYLGLINYLRGERDTGLGYIKQAIDIESKPYRVKLYEGLLSDSKSSQSDTNPPDSKTVT
jgi:tetratricopeptide (TPR) repeat protein